MRNPDKKCLSCHMPLEPEYYFCSITCACLAGYFHVRADGEHKDVKELENEEVRKKLLNNPPLRDRFEKRDIW